MFITRRTYRSTLSREMIVEQMKLLTQQWGSVQLLPGEQSTENSFSFRMTTSRYTTSVKGVLIEEGNYRGLTITYKPLINPFYWYVPLCILFFTCLFISKSFVINNEPVSRATGILSGSLMFLLFSLAMALFSIWRITNTRQKVEAALKLQQTS